MSVGVDEDLLAGLGEDLGVPLDTDLGQPGDVDDTPELDDAGQPRAKPVDQGAEIARLQAEIAAEKARREGREESGGAIAALREELAELRGRQSVTPAPPPMSAEQRTALNDRIVGQLSTDPLAFMTEYRDNMTEYIMQRVRSEFGRMAGPALGVGGDVVIDGYFSRRSKALTNAKMAEAVEAEYRAGVAELDPTDLIGKPKAERDRMLGQVYDAAMGRWTAKALEGRKATTPANLSGNSGTSAPAGKGTLLAQCVEKMGGDEAGYTRESTVRYARQLASREIAGLRVKDGKPYRPTDAEIDAKAIDVLAGYLDLKTGKRAS